MSTINRYKKEIWITMENKRRRLKELILCSKKITWESYFDYNTLVNSNLSKKKKRSSSRRSPLRQIKLSRANIWRCTLNCKKEQTQVRAVLFSTLVLSVQPIFDSIKVLNNRLANLIKLLDNACATGASHLFAGALVPNMAKGLIGTRTNERERDEDQIRRSLYKTPKLCCAPVVCRRRNRIYATHYST